ncbi:metallophosphoesterase [Mucilaginibacter sp. CSA2-8R]|uniref:metallophosphoesterase n=1 Tax=Mucilaginibacter sp. CSA2-8R TaxID=3141542 RepID=UPI00315C8FD4
MKIQVISDLHQEFGFRELSFSGADLIVFAGDTNLGIKGIEWIKARIKDVPVIYILGNHEYYKGAYPKTLNKIVAAAEGSNIHVLENKSLVIDDITFHGATLWTNFELFGNPRVSGSFCQGQMNDYRMIRKEPSYSKLRSVDTYNIHQASMKWLEQSLAESLTPYNIVVTHHAPSARSIPDVYRDDLVSAAYTSNLEYFITKHQPDYWVHGHIHQPSRYTIGKTVILCNPHGYIHDRDLGFDPKLMIDVPDGLKNRC